ncbi:MAG: hypothetical protein IJU44_00215 [Kiritimatiellae bacterium]|nr:hypothetical protein [Kiritimatiellia bacterium]
MNSKKIVLTLAIGFSALSLCAENLVWNGGAAGVWDLATSNWLAEDNSETVWQNGATAVFPNGATVNVTATVDASGLVFQYNGAMLIGRGMIRLNGAINAASGTINVINVDTVTGTAITKSGAGTVAAASLHGRVNVAEGVLQAGGSRFQNADVHVVSGATFTILGMPSQSASLLTNGSFEEPFYDGYRYPSAADQIPTGWDLPQYSTHHRVVHVNNSGSRSWGNEGFEGTSDCPDGSMMVGLQIYGAVAQTFTVAEAGVYDLSCVIFRRCSGDSLNEHGFTVLVDDIPAVFVFDPYFSKDWRRVSTGPLYFAAGSHKIELAGNNRSFDNTSFVDDVRLSVPSATEPTLAMVEGSTLTAEAGANVERSFTGAYLGHALASSLELAAMDINANANLSGGGTIAVNVLTAAAVAGQGGSWSTAALWANGWSLVAAGGAPTLLMDFPGMDGVSLVNDVLKTTMNYLALSAVGYGNVTELSGTGLYITDHDNSGYWSKVEKNGAGSAKISSSIEAASKVWVQVEDGDLSISNPIIGIEGRETRIHKLGRGTLKLEGGTTKCSNVVVCEGAVIMAQYEENQNPQIRCNNTRAALYFDLRQNYSGYGINMAGDGVAVCGTTGNGFTYEATSTFGLLSPVCEFDIGGNDLLTTVGFVKSSAHSNNEDVYDDAKVIKSGKGTLQFVNVNANVFNGWTTIRDGAVVLDHSELYNGEIHPWSGDPVATQPSLARDINHVVAISDAETAADATPALYGNLDGFISRRPIAIGPEAASVTLGSNSGVAGFLGGITLNRPDLTVGGVSGGTVVLGDITLGDSVEAAAINVNNGTALILDGSVPDAVSVAVSGNFEVGYKRALQSRLASLDFTGHGLISFDSNGYDQLEVSNLKLGAVIFKLRNEITGADYYGQSGVYTLFKYSGTFEGNVNNLTVDYSSQVEGYDYIFSDTGDAITLSIVPGGDNAVYTWIHDGSGKWPDNNWDHSNAPDGLGVSAVFGTAVSAPATVTLQDAYTLSGLSFVNNNTYTLTGGSILFDVVSGGVPTVSVDYGSHVIASGVTNLSSKAIEISAGVGKVTFDGDVVSDLDVKAGAVGFGPNAKLAGDIAVQDGASLALDNTVTLVGGDIMVEGALSGSGTLVKTGTGTITYAPTDLNGSFDGTLQVDNGTLALGAGVKPGSVALNGSARATGSTGVHGLVGTFYDMPVANTAQFMALCGKVYDYDAFRAYLDTLNVLGNYFFDCAEGSCFSDRATDAAVSLPEQYCNGSLHANADHWAAAWEGVITIPATGEYKFYATLDDSMIMAIDGSVKLAHTNCFEALDVCYLNAGPHRFYLGIFEYTGNAYANLFVTAPGETGKHLIPIEWFTPYFGMQNLTGDGNLEPENGSNVAIANFNRGFTDSLFNGTLYGKGNGLLATLGVGLQSFVYGSGNLLAGSGGIFISSGELDSAIVAVEERGSLFSNGGTVTSLSGNGAVNLGDTGLYLVNIGGDADSGISPDKQYTHLINFPLGTTATCNGVEFGEFGEFELQNWSTTAHTTRPVGGDQTFASLVDGFVYGSANETMTLKGLTPGSRYEFRIYFRNWDNNKRLVRSIFYVGGKPIASNTLDFDHCWGARDQFGAMVFRYTADDSGEMSVNFRSLLFDNPHSYAFSNELLAGAGPETSQELTLSTTEGTKGYFDGTLNGEGSLVQDGYGTQYYRGANALTGGITVNAGRAVLEAGGSVFGTATLGTAAVLELRNESSVGGLSGSGMVELTHGENGLWGELQADGTFADADIQRLVYFNSDADSGFGSSKKYIVAETFASGADTTKDVIPVNESFFRCYSPNNANTYYRDSRTGGSLSGLPTSSHGGGNMGNVAMGSDQGFYQILTGMCYNTATNALTVRGLISGKTYEMRIYTRVWEVGKNRAITVSYNPTSGTGERTQTMSLNEDDLESYLPRYIVCRFKASGNGHIVEVDSNTSDRFHCYAVSVEEARDYSRHFDIAEDQTFDGMITGLGEVKKLGGGTLTVNGSVMATGPWAINAGGLVFGNDSSTVGKVAVAGGAVFGGIGQVLDSLGVAANGTLVLGAAGSDGRLTVTKKAVIAAGAKAKAIVSSGNCGGIYAADLSLPANLSLDFETVNGSALPARATVFHSDAGFGELDLSGWTITVDGAPINSSTTVSIQNAGMDVVVENTGGTIMLLR